MSWTRSEVNSFMSSMKFLVFRLVLVVASIVFLFLLLEVLMRCLPKAADPSVPFIHERGFELLKVHPSREHPWSKDCQDPLKIAVIGVLQHTNSWASWTMPLDGNHI